MDRQTRDKLVSGTDQTQLASGNACWQTAPKVFEKFNEDFGPFNVDLFADESNHLCPEWFGPGSANPDALTTPWALNFWASGIGAYGNGFGNPPYGRFIQKVLEKAKQEVEGGFISTLLLPLRVTRAFKDHVLNGASHLLFCDKRLIFFEDGLPRVSFAKGKPRADTAVFDSVVVRYTYGHTGGPHVGLWEVPKHVSKEQIAMAAERLLGKAA